MKLIFILLLLLGSCQKYKIDTCVWIDSPFYPHVHKIVAVHKYGFDVIYWDDHTRTWNDLIGYMPFSASRGSADCPQEIK